MDMNNMRDRLINALLIGAATTIMIFATAWWLEPDDYAVEEEDFTVTIDCRSVIMQPAEFPENVVTECRNKVRFIRGTSLTVV